MKSDIFRIDTLILLSLLLSLLLISTVANDDALDLNQAEIYAIEIYSDADFENAVKTHGWPGNGSNENPFVIENENIRNLKIYSTSYSAAIRNNILGQVIMFIHDSIIESNTFNEGETSPMYIGGCYNNIANNSINPIDTASNLQSISVLGHGNVVQGNLVKNVDHGIVVLGNRNTVIYNHVEKGYNSETFTENIDPNEMYPNFEYGILLEGHHNNITTNHIQASIEEGIYIGTQSDNNTIVGNAFINNNGGSTQALEAGLEMENSTNVFDLNYWSDWISPDDDEDGIVDLPYEIDERGNADIRPSANVIEIPENPEQIDTMGSSSDIDECSLIKSEKTRSPSTSKTSSMKTLTGLPEPTFTPLPFSPLVFMLSALIVATMMKRKI